MAQIQPTNINLDLYDSKVTGVRVKPIDAQAIVHDQENNFIYKADKMHNYTYYSIGGIGIIVILLFLSENLRPQ